MRQRLIQHFQQFTKNIAQQVFRLRIIKRHNRIRQCTAVIDDLFQFQRGIVVNVTTNSTSLYKFIILRINFTVSVI